MINTLRNRLFMLGTAKAVLDTMLQEGYAAGDLTLEIALVEASQSLQTVSDRVAEDITHDEHETRTTEER